MNIKNLFEGARLEPAVISGQWQGEVGKRQEFTLTCTRIISLTIGYYVKIYCFNDLEGNAFVWMASRDGKFDEGGCYRVRATVKKHRVYRGVRQTDLMRPHIIGPYIAPIQSEKVTGKTIVDIWNSL